MGEVRPLLPEEVPDVCLILEGTYPYVTGGVSSWTHQLITRLPEIRFHLYCLIAEREPGPWLYPRPGNVAGVTNLSLGRMAEVLGGEGRSLAPEEEEALVGVVRNFHRELLAGDPEAFGTLFGAFGRAGLSPELFRTLSAGRKAWSLIREFYGEQFAGESFLDFFWMWRTTHLPLFALLSAPLPPAGLYHALASGYAGMVGVMGKLAFNRPLILTEHGIYTRERKIEIALAQWIGTAPESEVAIRPIRETIKGFWMRIFEQLGRIVYHYSDHVITLFEGNRRIQIRDGASPEKTRVVPNGIALPENLPPRAPLAPEEIRTVALIGRVVPIKDVKTFLQACRLVVEQDPRARFLVMGPLDQDPDYAAECLSLVELLELSERITFTGSVRVEEYFPRIDLLVLTSLSEAQPLVIMEAAAWGIPSVATRVGACDELVNGRSREDRMLGPGGIVTSVGNPEETALAILRLLRDDSLRNRMGRSARARMERFYREEDLFETYRDLYREGAL